MPSWLEASWLDEVARTVTTRLPALGIGLAILLGGWLGAFVAYRVLYFVLCRTDLRMRLVRLMGGEAAEKRDFTVERVLSRAVYYVLLVAVLVVFFNYLRIDAVTQPLLTALDGLAAAVPNLLKAAVLGLGGFLLAVIVRRVVAFSLDKVGLDRWLTRLTTEGEPEQDQAVSALLSNIAYWFVLIVAAIPVLEALRIGMLAQPLSAAFESITVYLPKIGGAVLLLIAGYLLARLARVVVTGVLERVGIDQLLGRVGFERALRGQALSGILGAIAMAFVLLHFAISAVGRLEIEEISRPLGQVLEQVYAYLPKLLIAGVLMAVGVVIAKVAGNLAGRLLAAMGFNTLLSHIGLYREVSEDARRQEAESRRLVEQRMGSQGGEAPDSSPSQAPDPAEGGLLSPPERIRTPADIAGLIVSVVVVLLFAQQVLFTLQLEGLAEMLDGLMAFLPNVLVAVVVLGAGLWAGRWASTRLDELTEGSGDRMLRAAGPSARIAIIAFAIIMALQQLGVGEELLTRAFTLVVGAVALALALSFGLGGREVAARILDEEYQRRNRQ